MSEQPAVSRQDLLDAVLDSPAIVARCRISRVELEPGQAAGLRFHPGHVIGYVLRGTIRFQIGDRPERLLTAGDAFHEPARAHVPHFDNASPDEGAVFLACYLLEKNDSSRCSSNPRHVPAQAGPSMRVDPSASFAGLR
ncbi:MAG: cupin domain-containing protein [Solirubrobacterales bacterium]|nr:cupin domain-containing protein [Solirubrobacterales bacterium]